MSMPLPGTFIRPVGPTGFRYCLKVARVSGGRVRCARWGMRANLPFDDGCGSQTDVSVDLLPVRAGVWKPDLSAWTAQHMYPVYWVRTGDSTGQLDLFGGPPA